MINQIIVSFKHYLVNLIFIQSQTCFKSYSNKTKKDIRCVEEILLRFSIIQATTVQIRSIMKKMG
jgi:hypothetical protein